LVVGDSNAAGANAADGSVDEEQIRVSGSLDSHYAPVATVVLDQSPVAGQGFIAMADVATPDGVVRLAAPKAMMSLLGFCMQRFGLQMNRGCKQLLLHSLLVMELQLQSVTG
jgi:hypothetical protein